MSTTTSRTGKPRKSTRSERGRRTLARLSFFSTSGHETMWLKILIKHWLALLCQQLTTVVNGDQFVADLLKSGMYQTQSEILRERLRLLKEKEDLKQLRFAELRKEIAIGSAEADRGEFVDGEETFASIRKRSAQRKRAKG